MIDASERTFIISHLTTEKKTKSFNEQRVSTNNNHNRQRSEKHTATNNNNNYNKWHTRQNALIQQNQDKQSSYHIHRLTNRV